MKQASQCTYCRDQHSRKQIESFGDIGTHERSCLSVISFETDCMVLPGAKIRKIKKLNQRTNNYKKKKRRTNETASPPPPQFSQLT